LTQYKVVINNVSYYPTRVELKKEANLISSVFKIFLPGIEPVDVAREVKIYRDGFLVCRGFSEVVKKNYGVEGGETIVEGRDLASLLDRYCVGRDLYNYTEPAMIIRSILAPTKELFGVVYQTDFSDKERDKQGWSLHVEGKRTWWKAWPPPMERIYDTPSVGWNEPVTKLEVWDDIQSWYETRFLNPDVVSNWWISLKGEYTTGAETRYPPSPPPTFVVIRCQSETPQLMACNGVKKGDFDNPYNPYVFYSLIGTSYCVRGSYRNVLLKSALGWSTSELGKHTTFTGDNITYGLVARFKDVNNFVGGEIFYYYNTHAERKMRIYQKVNGVKTVLAETDLPSRLEILHLRTHCPERIYFETAGNKAKFYFDVPNAEVTAGLCATFDSSLDQGAVGFSFGNFKADATPQVGFRNLTIVSVPVISAFENEFNAVFMADKDEKLFWQSSSNQNAGQWVQIDLGEAKTVRRIRVLSNTLWYPRNYRIDVSLDGVNWTQAYAKSNNKAANIDFIFSSPQTLRYIKITLTAPYPAPWAISEIMIYEPDGDEILPAGEIEETNIPVSLHFDYETRLEAVEMVAKMVNWDVWVGLDGKLHFKPSRGTDKSGEVKFETGKNIFEVKRLLDFSGLTNKIVHAPGGLVDLKADTQVQESIDKYGLRESAVSNAPGRAIASYDLSRLKVTTHDSARHVCDEEAERYAYRD
jgi:hypothetical protein